MNCNLLFSKIMQLQDEYRELLSMLLPSLKSDNILAALDEINLFWLKKIDLVELYLTYEFSGKNSYVFTASTFMDYDDNEQFPFLSFGDHHILDDPLCAYCDIYKHVETSFITSKLSEQIILTAEDNIKLLENCEKAIIILPLKILSRTPKDSFVFELGEKVFTELFDDINSISEYFTKCASIEDIIQHSAKNMEIVLCLSDCDNSSLPLKERFQNAKIVHSYVVNEKLSDAYNFFVLVFGPIQEAVNVVASCIEYQCIPFIRNAVVLHYVLLLCANLTKIPHILRLRYYMCIANATYQICDKHKLSKGDFFNFLSEKESFFQNLLASLAENHINESEFDIHVAIPIIQHHLDELYSKLSKQSS